MKIAPVNYNQKQNSNQRNFGMNVQILGKDAKALVESGSKRVVNAMYKSIKGIKDRKGSNSNVLAICSSPGTLKVSSQNTNTEPLYLVKPTPENLISALQTYQKNIDDSLYGAKTSIFRRFVDTDAETLITNLSEQTKYFVAEA